MPKKPRTDVGVPRGPTNEYKLSDTTSFRPTVAVDVPDRPTFRISPALRQGIADYCAANNMRLSQGLRTLLFMGLHSAKMGPESAFKAAAFREGVIEGMAAFKRNFQEAVSKTLIEAGDVAETLFEEGKGPKPSSTLKPFDPNE